MYEEDELVKPELQRKYVWDKVEASRFMLFEINENKTWRELFGTEEADSRMRDLEYILRFFTMKTGDILDTESKQISLKKALNDFMKTHKEDSPADIQRFKDEFDTTVQKWI